MKKILPTLLVLLLAGTIVTAQKTFEGTIAFKTTYTGDGADQFAAFMPTGMTYQFRGQDARVEMQGGMAGAMMGPIVTKGADDIAYMLRATEQVAYKMTDDASDSKDEMPDIKVTQEDEVIDVLGHSCQKYTVLVKQDDQEVEMNLWTTTDIMFHRPKTGQNNMFVEGVNGFPLKKMTKMDMMGIQITSTEVATEISTDLPSADLFEIPAGWEVKVFSPAAMGGR